MKEHIEKAFVACVCEYIDSMTNHVDEGKSAYDLPPDVVHAIHGFMSSCLLTHTQSWLSDNHFVLIETLQYLNEEGMVSDRLRESCERVYLENTPSGLWPVDFDERLSDLVTYFSQHPDRLGWLVERVVLRRPPRK